MVKLFILKKISRKTLTANLVTKPGKSKFMKSVDNSTLFISTDDEINKVELSKNSDEVTIWCQMPPLRLKKAVKLVGRP